MQEKVFVVAKTKERQQERCEVIFEIHVYKMEDRRIPKVLKIQISMMRARIRKGKKIVLTADMSREERPHIVKKPTASSVCWRTTHKLFRNHGKLQKDLAGTEV